MRRLLILLPLVAGCVSVGGTAGTDPPPESAVRLPLRQRLVPTLEKLLKRDGWAGEVVARRGSGTIATSVGEGWSEDGFVLDVAARTPDDTPLLIPVADYTPILETLRRRLRDVVEDHGGTQADWAVLEGYKERTLVFVYRQGRVGGVVRVTMAAKADRPDELLTRVELSVREQPLAD